MILPEANAGKAVDDAWHHFRAVARHVAFSPEEFSPAERVRYNLNDDDNFAPARITGANNPQTREGVDVGPETDLTREKERPSWMPEPDDPVR